VLGLCPWDEARPWAARKVKLDNIEVTKRVQQPALTFTAANRLL